MKKIIFIGGTARSGSTLLDLVIANDPKAISLGEIHALFEPTRKHHFVEIERLKQDNVWKKIIRGGKKNLYQNLIKYFPEIDIFVDSSKDPFWCKYHQKSHNKNYIAKNVLIHKTPHELANSFIKRRKDKEWIKTYINYHRKYFSLIDDFVSISYKELITNKSCLEKLCEKLDIIYFKKKINYWDRKQITFFGSNSVKSDNSHKAKSQLTNQERNEIKYDGIRKKFIDYVNKNIENNTIIPLIEDEIKRHDVFSKAEKIKNRKFGFGKVYLLLFSIKRYFKHKYYYYFPQNIFK